ncbi:MAG: helix-turn-helix domain-containing protein [Lachnospiraceae bacterium]|nr:helix-turn-helix domain-containing protein [Candidatus Merdinaster equi]
MLTNQVIEKTIKELQALTKVHMAVYDTDGNMLATTDETISESTKSLVSFAQSPADSQIIGDLQLMKVMDEEDISFLLVVRGSGPDSYMIGSIAVHELSNLLVAYKDKVDKNSFIQNLLLDNLLLVDIYNQAKKLKVDEEVARAVYVVAARPEQMDIISATLGNIYSQESGDFITSVDAGVQILVKALDSDSGDDQMEEVAYTISDMLNTEAMVDVRVAYGTRVASIKDVSKSYKEAKMAMEVGRIFYAEKKIVSYSSLGIGRLIYQLPVNLCRIFIDEVFGPKSLDELDDETLLTVRRFLENNQNVSETSRQLYIHRNTLINRIERLQKITGLDIRLFNDAMTLQIALMVVNYMKYLESVDE